MSKLGAARGESKLDGAENEGASKDGAEIYGIDGALNDGIEAAGRAKLELA